MKKKRLKILKLLFQLIEEKQKENYYKNLFVYYIILNRQLIEIILI